MKIENFEGALDTFTFPQNPNVFDTVTDSNHEVTPISFQRHHIAVSGGGVSPKNLILNGHLFGASKLTEFRDLSKHFAETMKLKKLYFESDKFYIGLGRQLKKTHTGGRTNFIDYVGAFETIIGMLFGDTVKTSGTNAGNVTTFVHELLGTYDGSGDVTIGDALGNEITLDSTVFSGTEDIIYRLVKMVNSGTGIFVSEYAWVGIEVDSGTASSTTTDKLVEAGQNFVTTVSIGDLVENTTDSTYANVTAVDSNTTLSLNNDIMVSGETYVIYTQTKNVQTTGGFGLPQIAAGANVSTITTANLTSVTTKFRDGYAD